MKDSANRSLVEQAYLAFQPGRNNDQPVEMAPKYDSMSDFARSPLFNLRTINVINIDSTIEMPN